MEIGMIGLGRMGGNMARRLLHGGHQVIVFDPVPAAREGPVKEGATGAASIDEMVRLLKPPRAVWLMVPAGAPTEQVVNRLVTRLSPGDIVIDGGNSNYGDSMRRAAGLADRSIALLDVGTSGGIWGLEQGYCLTIGGDATAFRHLEPIFQTLAPSPTTGYTHVGPSGAGHYVKMVHNGIEYGLMEAYAEGFELLLAKTDFRLDAARIAETWRHGSVVRSWLLDLTANTLKEDPRLAKVGAYVEDSGEGRWAVEEGVKLGVPLPVITLALQARFRSRQEQPFGGRLLAALRRQFGGHAVRETEPDK